MKRVSSLTLGLLLPLIAFACSSDPDDTGTTNPPGTSGTGNTTAGTGNTTGATGSATAGASTGGSPGTAGAGGAATAGAATGGAGASAGGAGGSTGGAATGGGGAATGGGGASAGGSAGGGGGAGGSNPACPAKIDSKTACTQVISCPNATCGVFKLGAKNCDCATASGNFTCTSCDYTGKTEAIVQKPAAALPACTADDATLEATASCTSGDRCASMTANRFCACWTDPAKGGTVWDCDAVPKSWQ